MEQSISKCSSLKGWAISMLCPIAIAAWPGGVSAMSFYEICVFKTVLGKGGPGVIVAQGINQCYLRLIPDAEPPPRQHPTATSPGGGPSPSPVAASDKSCQDLKKDVAEHQNLLQAYLAMADQLSRDREVANFALDTAEDAVESASGPLESAMRICTAAKNLVYATADPQLKACNKLHGTKRQDCLDGIDYNTIVAVSEKAVEACTEKERATRIFDMAVDARLRAKEIKADIQSRMDRNEDYIRRVRDLIKREKQAEAAACP